MRNVSFSLSNSQAITESTHSFSKYIRIFLALVERWFHCVPINALHHRASKNSSHYIIGIFHYFIGHFHYISGCSQYFIATFLFFIAPTNKFVQQTTLHLFVTNKITTHRLWYQSIIITSANLPKLLSFYHYTTK